MTVLPRSDLAHPDGRRVFVYGEHVRDLALAPLGAEIEIGAIHRRLDLMTREWVAISPERNVRPLDSVDTGAESTCPICPGGIELPFAFEAAVFENRFPSFVANAQAPPELAGITASSQGSCELVVYTSRHDSSFSSLTPLELGRLLAIWSDRARELWADERHEFVMVFENRGAEAGATLAHPHGQIYALDFLPPIAAVKAAAHLRFREQEGRCLGCHVATAEDAASRLVAENESFLVAVPFAPRWPYEVAVRARRHGLRRLSDLAPEEQLDLARGLRDVALRYDALFGFECPYLMVAQEAPRGQDDWHLAFEFYPLQRSATTMKIRASVETATGLFLNDVLPERAAERLAALEVQADPLDASCLFDVGPPEIDPATLPLTAASRVGAELLESHDEAT
jgi:UDPglucose--hexose-1-phosphate uridylyltransferase